MKPTQLAAFFVFALMGCTKPTASERAVEFTSAAMKGERLELEEWFAPGVSETDFVRIYGGPEKFAADSKRQADAEGGVKSIEVVREESLADGIQILSVQTTFSNGKKSESNETWKLFDGKWKLTPPGGSDAPAP